MALEVPPPDLIEASAVSGSRTSSTIISLVLLAVSVTFAVSGQVTLKAAMNRIGRIGTEQVSNMGDTLGRAIREPRLWAGLLLFGISALFWLVVISRVPLSLAYPFVGLSYIVVVALDKFVFGEQVPGLRWVGVLIVAAGIALIGLTSKTATGG